MQGLSARGHAAEQRSADRCLPRNGGCRGTCSSCLRARREDNRPHSAPRPPVGSKRPWTAAVCAVQSPCKCASAHASSLSCRSLQQKVFHTDRVMASKFSSWPLAAKACKRSSCGKEHAEASVSGQILFPASRASARCGSAPHASSGGGRHQCSCSHARSCPHRRCHAAPLIRGRVQCTGKSLCSERSSWAFLAHINERLNARGMVLSQSVKLVQHCPPGI